MADCCIVKRNMLKFELTESINVIFIISELFIPLYEILQSNNSPCSCSVEYLYVIALTSGEIYLRHNNLSTSLSNILSFIVLLHIFNTQFDHLQTFTTEHLILTPITTSPDTTIVFLKTNLKPCALLM